MYKILSPPLIRIHLDITNKCNARCKFCLNNSGRSLENEMSTEVCLKLLNDASKVGVRFLRILGGEPFIRKDIVSIINASASLGIQTLFSTNGTLLTKNIVSGLKSARESIRYSQVSLYGASSRDYEQICGDKKLFKKACLGINNLASEGINPVVFSVITPSSLPKLKDLYKIACDNGAKAFRISLAYALGRAKGAVDGETSITNNQLFDSLQKTFGVNENRVPIQMTEYSAYSDFLKSKFPISIIPLSCCAGTSEMYISSDGTSYPCPFFKHHPVFKSFEIMEEVRYPVNSIEEIWNSKYYEKFRELHESHSHLHKHENCNYYINGSCTPCPLSNESCHDKVKIYQNLEEAHA